MGNGLDLLEEPSSKITEVYAMSNWVLQPEDKTSLFQLSPLEVDKALSVLPGRPRVSRGQRSENKKPQVIFCLFLRAQYEQACTVVCSARPKHREHFWEDELLIERN